MDYKTNMGVRLASYLIGLFLLTIGIAISIKSSLGISPVSSIPYTVQLIAGIDIGIATIIYHAILAIVQFLILRKQFNPFNFIQILVGVVFGFLTTFSKSIFIPILPDPTGNIALQFIYLIISTVIVAFGLFFYVPAEIMPIAVEGTILAISQKVKGSFSTVKIIFDSCSVVISLVLCLIFLHSLGSVGIGTVISAIIIGMELKFLNKKIGHKRDKILKHKKHAK